MNFFDRFLNVINNFEKEGVDYVLIGGYAIVLHGFARLTQDIDVFLNPTRNNVERFKKSLKNIYNDNAIDEISLSELEAYPIIRYGTEDGFYIDIIVKIGTRFKFDDINFQVKEIEGVKIKVATPETLFALKKDSYREIDQPVGYTLS